MLPRFVLTLRRALSPAPDGCEWASMKPGTTVAPAASITGVSAVARFRTSSLEPTATNRSPETAKASARGFESSWVRTSPFTTIRSGGVAAVPPPAHPVASPAVASVPSPRKSFRLIPPMRSSWRAFGAVIVGSRSPPGQSGRTRCGASPPEQVRQPRRAASGPYLAVIPEPQRRGASTEAWAEVVRVLGDHLGSEAGVSGPDGRPSHAPVVRRDDGPISAPLLQVRRSAGIRHASWERGQRSVSPSRDGTANPSPARDVGRAHLPPRRGRVAARSSADRGS